MCFPTAAAAVKNEGLKPEVPKSSNRSRTASSDFTAGEKPNSFPLELHARSNISFGVRTEVIISICVRMSQLQLHLCNVPCFKERLVRRIQRELPDDETLTDAVSVFSALADRARLKIILALRDDEELCVCDVAHVLNVSISTAPHHLRKLRDLRVVKYRSDGKMACYSLRDEIVARLVTDALEKVEA